MKFTVMGFSQRAVLDINEISENKIDIIDLTILRWFVDFCHTDKMTKMIENGETYYWVKYQTVLDNLPILNIGKRMLAARFQKMVNVGILKSLLRKNGGTFTLYSFGDKYETLISDTVQKNARGVNKFTTGDNELAKGCKNISNTGDNELATGLSINLHTKDYSIKDSSIKDSSINNICRDVAEKSPTSPTVIQPVIQLITNKENEFFDITQQHIDDFQKWYPNVNVMQELNEMQAWLVSNPTKRKTKRGMMSFVNRWLSREQDKPQRQYTIDSGYQQQQPSTNTTGNPFADALLAQGGN